MDYFSFSDLSNEIVNNIHLIPRDVDVIVGVPRSGMLVACMIGLYLNKPIADLDSFLNKNIYSLGVSKARNGWVNHYNEVKRILLVEDSVNSGASITKAKERLAEKYSKEKITLAVYVSNKGKEFVDIYFKEVMPPRLFEWNYLHRKDISPYTCFDIDGVLCVDPLISDCDNDENYKTFLLSAKPKLIPSAKVGYLVTARLEKYRDETEIWLKKHGISYGELIMYDGSAEQRRRLNNHAEFKAKVYKRLKKTILFIESDSSQAEIIRAISGKQVFCIDNQLNYPPSNIWMMKKKIKIRLKRLIPNKVKQFIIRIINLK